MHLDTLATGIALGMVLQAALYEFVYPRVAHFLSTHGWR